MWAENVKWAAWFAALLKDPRQATYLQRVAASVVGNFDTFNQYSLQRLNYRPATTEELTLAQASINDRFIVWTLYQVDLDQASAPLPVVGYQFQVASNAGVLENWNIEQVLNVNLMVSYDCLSRWVPQGS